MMKKFLVIALILGVFQNRDSIQDFFSDAPDVPATNGGVVLYATDWCGYCQKTRELFAKHDIPYIEYDIEKSSQGYREYRDLGGRGVPVINANGTVIHGYSAQRILAAASPTTP